MRALHAQRRGHAVAHGAEAAGGHPVVWMLELEILRRPHLVLPDLGRDEGRAGAGQLVKPLDGMLRLDRLAELLELQAVESAPFVALLRTEEETSELHTIQRI